MQKNTENMAMQNSSRYHRPYIDDGDRNSHELISNANTTVSGTKGIARYFPRSSLSVSATISGLYATRIIRDTTIIVMALKMRYPDCCIDHTATNNNIAMGIWMHSRKVSQQKHIEKGKPHKALHHFVLV